MTLNDLLSWMSDDYRQKLEAKKAERLRLQEERKKSLLDHYKHNYSGPNTDADPMFLHHQWREKWPLLFKQLDKPHQPIDLKDELLLGNKPFQREKKYY